MENLLLIRKYQKIFLITTVIETEPTREILLHIAYIKNRQLYETATEAFDFRQNYHKHTPCLPTKEPFPCLTMTYNNEKPLSK